MFFLLTMLHRRFKKILCVGTLFSTKDRVELKTVMVSVPMELIFQQRRWYIYIKKEMIWLWRAEVPYGCRTNRSWFKKKKNILMSHLLRGRRGFQVHPHICTLEKGTTKSKQSKQTKSETLIWTPERGREKPGCTESHVESTLLLGLWDLGHL